MKIYLIILFLLAGLFSKKMEAQCWNLVWADEFEGTQLDLTKWSYQTGAGGWGNNEWQHYTNRTDNAQVSGGKLKIIAKQESYNSSNYTSARLRTLNKGDFRYGRIEMLAKLPQTQGIWPAFWMMPTEAIYGSWPNSGEIDIMELLGHQPATTYGTLHTTPAAGGGASAYSTSSYTLPSGSFASGFHTFAIEWEPSAIRWYVDNTVFATKTPADLSPWRFTELFHLILNIAVGGNWPGYPNHTTIFPQTMEIDYVRVYQRNEDLTIRGKSKIEVSETAQYSLPAILNATYYWTIPNGMSILSGQGSPQISISGTTSGSINCTVTTSCGSIVLTKNVTVSANMLENPSFEKNFDFWNNNFHNNSHTIANISISTNSPQHLLKKACATTHQLPTNTWDIQISQPNINLVAGQSYTLKFWASASAPNKKVSAAVIHAVTYSGFMNQTFNVGTSWQEYEVTFTPNNSATAMLNFDCGHSVATVCFDNVFLGKTNLLSAVHTLAHSDNNWTIFPNPTNGNITIAQNSENPETRQLYLYNSVGQMVLNQTIENPTTELNLVRFPKGMYILKIGEKGFKVMVED
jgi:beta-glucanase (GH16 family)